MAEVTSYHLLVHGSREGYMHARAQITLMNGEQAVGIIRFHDPGSYWPDDREREDGLIVAHMPTHAYPHVVDILRNERPINLFFARGRAFLGTRTLEPVGEHEVNS